MNWWEFKWKQHVSQQNHTHQDLHSFISLTLWAGIDLNVSAQSRIVKFFFHSRCVERRTCMLKASPRSLKSFGGRPSSLICTIPDPQEASPQVFSSHTLRMDLRRMTRFRSMAFNVRTVCLLLQKAECSLRSQYRLRWSSKSSVRFKTLRTWVFLWLQSRSALYHLTFIVCTQVSPTADATENDSSRPGSTRHHLWTFSLMLFILVHKFQSVSHKEHWFIFSWLNSAFVWGHL